MVATAPKKEEKVVHVPVDIYSRFEDKMDARIKNLEMDNEDLQKRLKRIENALKKKKV
jgi:hypothetical protein